MDVYEFQVIGDLASFERDEQEEDQQDEGQNKVEDADNHCRLHCGFMLQNSATNAKHTRHVTSSIRTMAKQTEWFL